MRSLLRVLPLVAGFAVAVEAQSSTVQFPVDRIVALVGRVPILWTEVQEQINIRRASGMQIPEDPAEQLKLARRVLEDMVDVEVMVQRAQLDTAIVVEESELQEGVEQQMKRIRENFQSDQELAQALKTDGFGSIEEYRRWVAEQARRGSLQRKLVQKLRQDGKMVTVGVSEAEITETFERERGRLPKRPATVTFRQIVIATEASPAAKRIALAKAESLLVELTKEGGDFASIAKRASMDSLSAAQGGDLGWTRRQQMVAAFDAMLFALPVGQISPIVETGFGFHIIRVDRAQPAERKARHILIKPTYDSLDVARTRHLADSVLRQWKAGTPFDTLVNRYHDLAADEARGILEPFERAKLPESYQRAFDGKKDGDFVEPFELADPSRGVPKFVIAQVIHAAAEGDYTIQDLRNQIRDQLAEEKSMRRLLDNLRRETFVSILLEEPAKVASP
jgi:peptidyl-prolyl cis-trans isomerase SurA